MTIRSSEFFIFNGVRSDEFGIRNVSVDSSGMANEPFTANKTIKETKVRYNPIPYFLNTEYDKLKFNVSFAFEDTFDEAKIREVAYWLTSPTFYAPLTFSDNYYRIYYAIFDSSPELIHNYLQQGYINIGVSCDGPFTYTPVYNQIYDFSTNVTNGTNIVITNYGDVECYPMLYAQVVNGGTFTITNNSNGGEKLSFTGIANNETLIIDCDHKNIETDVDNTYRYDNMTSDSKFIKLLRGDNHLNVKGNVKLKFVTQYKTLQG